MEDKHEDPFPPIDGLLRVGEECYDEHGNLFGEAATKSMGAKHDQGKVRPSLILSGFPRAILAVAEVGMYGLTMHPEGSWKEVPNGVARFLDAKDRHRLYGAIDPLDPDSGLLHLAHECWNALAALELILTEKEKDLSN
jgi:hypothetical protein